MDLDQLASYLQRDARDLQKMASRGHLPAHKVSGEWRFHPAEISQWLETQMASCSERQLTALEHGTSQTQIQQPLITSMLSENTMAVPLAAATKASVLKQLVRLAEQSWEIYDAEAVYQAVRQREELGSTAVEGGVAIPHPRPLPNLLGNNVLAYGRLGAAIPFGAPSGGLTDIFFLVCCRDTRTHLSVLARLARLLRRPGFLDDLRTAETVPDTLQVIEAAETDLAVASG
jgi:PTS system nitrogen regulatory IIA component